jgi:hypothetical protein
VTQNADGVWRLSIPAGPARRYRLAQLDDYLHRPRQNFAWRPPLTLELRARVSAPDLPGTWGFGFWNDPFNASIGIGGTARRLPALPNAAWFFYASPPNYLALRDSHPAAGFVAGLFSAPRLHPLLLAPAVPFLPLLAWNAAARLLRRAARRLVQEDAAALDVDVTAWHVYRLELSPDRAAFLIDGSLAFESTITPRPPLGLVIWIDNQYAAFPPDGRLRFGSLASSTEAWLEVDCLSVIAR